MRGIIRAESASKFAPPYPQMGERDKQLVSRDGRAMAGMDALRAGIYFSGSPDGHPLELPNLRLNMISAMAATRDGFVVGNGGLVSSSDGKLIAVENGFGAVEVWELL